MRTISHLMRSAAARSSCSWFTVVWSRVLTPIRRMAFPALQAIAHPSEGSPGNEQLSKRAPDTCTLLDSRPCERHCRRVDRRPAIGFRGSSSSSPRMVRSRTCTTVLTVMSDCAVLAGKWMQSPVTLGRPSFCRTVRAGRPGPSSHLRSAEPAPCRACLKVSTGQILSRRRLQTSVAMEPHARK